MYISLHTCISGNMYVYMYVYMYRYMYAYMHVSVTFAASSEAQEGYLARASDSFCCSACMPELSDKLTLIWLSCRAAELCCCCCCCCSCCRRCCCFCKACVSLWSAASLSSLRVRATAAATSSLPAPIMQTTLCQPKWGGGEGGWGVGGCWGFG